MKLSSTAIVNGFYQDHFGKRGLQFSPNGMPTFSPQILIENAPENTQYFALFLEDRDAIPVSGFSWIHWVAANIEKTGSKTEILENISINAPFVQGTNSWSGKLGGLSREEATGYGGMAPPDRPHTYDLYIYALDKRLDLKSGFYANELFKAMDGHILASAKLSAAYCD